MASPLWQTVVTFQLLRRFLLQGVFPLASYCMASNDEETYLPVRTAQYHWSSDNQKLSLDNKTVSFQC